MTAAQLSLYRSLWAAACRVQGWDAADAALRRRVRAEIVGQESTRTLDEGQITHLYRRLRFLARPDDLRAAMSDAGPKDAAEANRRRQLVYVITERLGFADGYIMRCASGACRVERVADWRALSADALDNLRRTLTTRARQRDAKAGVRAPFTPRAKPYHLRPEAKAKRRAAERALPCGPRPAPRGSSDAHLFPF